MSSTFFFSFFSNNIAHKHLAPSNSRMWQIACYHFELLSYLELFFLPSRLGQCMQPSQSPSKERAKSEEQMYHSEIHFQKLVLLGEQWGNHVWIGETLWMRADYCSCLTPQGDGELLDSIVVHYGSSGCVNSQPLSQSWYDKTVPASSSGSASSPPPHTHTQSGSHISKVSFWNEGCLTEGFCGERIEKQMGWGML